jgi:hypothetical protein
MAALNFLGIGAHKAGTTWLYQMLDMHPQIGLPAGKELHFWDRKWPAGDRIEDYESTFSALAKPIKGEITPAYAILPPSTIAVIYDRYPGLKLIYVLRNPIERAWSHARMAFSKLVSQDTENAIKTHRDWFLEHFRVPDSLLRGDYETCLANWRGIFPGSQLLIGLQDDIIASPATFLKSSCMLLDADPSFYDALHSATLEERIYPEIVVWKSTPSSLPRAVPEEFFASLVEIYAPKIKSLSTLLDRDLITLWLSPYK